MEADAIDRAHRPDLPLKNDASRDREILLQVGYFEDNIIFVQAFALLGGHDLARHIMLPPREYRPNKT